MYEESEKVIQQLLAEAGAKGLAAGLSPVEPAGEEVAADGSTLASGETYVGYGRADNFSSRGGPVDDRQHVYAAPSRLELNHWALSGDWTLGEEAAVANKAGGRIVYRFHARDVNLILGPATPATPVRFRVRIDGKTPDAAHGVDVNDQGEGVITRQRMYQLIRQPAPIIDREFSIEFRRITQKRNSYESCSDPRHDT